MVQCSAAEQEEPVSALGPAGLMSAEGRQWGPVTPSSLWKCLTEPRASWQWRPGPHWWLLYLVPLACCFQEHPRVPSADGDLLSENSM